MDDKRDKRLRKTYNLTLAEYNQILAEQGFGCAICGRKPAGRALHVDHDHQVAKEKVTTFHHLDGKGWTAWAHIHGKTYETQAKKKADAVRGVRRQLLRASCRGVLCWRCNASLQKLSDDPKLFRAAAEYLERYYNG